MKKIPFTKPTLIGNEIAYIKKALLSDHLVGGGVFTKKVQDLLCKKYGFAGALLTHSCTAALEMAALLLDISKGDEVIVPSYTFVSTASSFALRGAKIVFADSCEDSPNVSVESIENLITHKTRAVVVVHYGGIACDMDAIKKLTEKHGLALVEDAAQAIDSWHRNVPLGSIGDFGAFSFHATKNIISGEGGLLSINRSDLLKRAEIVWEKGTNRRAYMRGEIDKYSWVDLGSSFLPSELTAAFLLAQVECIETIQRRRKEVWKRYDNRLTIVMKQFQLFQTPVVPNFATQNGHNYFLIMQNREERQKFIEYMSFRGVTTSFHYVPLHSSPYYKEDYDGEKLPNCDRISDCLIRLPLYGDITNSDVDYICDQVYEYFAAKKNR